MDNGVGGQIKGISLDSFLQMVQMERTTCTLKIVHGQRQGLIYVLEGELIDADYEKMAPFEAACHIISWLDPIIEIDNRCDRSENLIKQPLMHVLMEGLRLRDEQQVAAPGRDGEPVQSAMPDQASAEAVAARSPVPTAEKDVLAERKASFKRRLILVAAGGAAILATISAVFMFQSYHSNQARAKMLAAVAAAQDPRTRLQILDTYLAAVQNDAHRQQAEALRNQTAHAWQQETFSKVRTKAEAAVAQNRLDEAVAAYQAFSKQFKAGPSVVEAAKRIKSLQVTLAESAYQRLVSDADTLGPLAVESYAAFLREHPDSPHTTSARQALADLQDGYYSALSNQIKDCRRKEQWHRCIELASRYEPIYGDDNRAREFSRMQDEFLKRLDDHETLEKLIAIAQQAGDDLAAARQVFSDFLKAVPNSPLREKVQAEIARIDRQTAANALKQRYTAVIEDMSMLGDRFTAGTEGTFTDRRSKLVWCLLDSMESGGGSCLDYDAAKVYVKALSTGGYTDWRLPTVSELAGLYKSAPFFPAGQAPWYWSAETYVRYIGVKKVTNVNIVTARPESEWQVQSRDTLQCGAVRAVRP